MDDDDYAHMKANIAFESVKLILRLAPLVVLPVPLKFAYWVFQNTIETAIIDVIITIKDFVITVAMGVMEQSQCGF